MKKSRCLYSLYNVKVVATSSGISFGNLYCIWNLLDSCNIQDVRLASELFFINYMFCQPGSLHAFNDFTMSIVINNFRLLLKRITQIVESVVYSLSLSLSAVIGCYLTGSSTWFHHTSFYLSDRKFHNSFSSVFPSCCLLDSFLKSSSQHKWCFQMVVRGLKAVFVAKYLYLSVVPALYESSFLSVLQVKFSDVAHIYYYE